MKDIFQIIKNSNLTGRERALLFIHSEIELLKSNKPPLKDSDIYLLLRNYTPKNIHEQRVFHSLIESWEIVKKATATMHFKFQDSESKLLKACLFVSLLNNKSREHTFQSYLSEEQAERAEQKYYLSSKILISEAIYHITINSLSEDMICDIEKLYDGYKTDMSYMYDEYRINKLLNNTTDTVESNLDQLSDMITDSYLIDEMRNYIQKSKDGVQIALQGYFGSIPHYYFIKSLAKQKSLSFSSNTELFESFYKLKDSKNLLKKEVRRKLDEGMFENDYIPLCKSDNKDTVCGEVTQNSHREIITKFSKVFDYIKNDIEKVVTNDSNQISLSELKSSGYISFFNAEISRHRATTITFFEMQELLSSINFIELYQEAISYKSFIDQCSSLLECDMSFHYHDFFSTTETYFDLLNELLKNTLVDQKDSIITLMENTLSFKPKNMVPRISDSLQKHCNDICEAWKKEVIKL